MSLLTLPAELRLRIYDYLPDLQPNRIETLTAYSNLTPAISRVNVLLRHETLGIFTTNSNFTIAMDDRHQFWLKRLTTWMNSLSPGPLSRVRSLQLSRHWNIPAPMRWQGHSGFYVRIERPKLKKVQTFTISTSSSTDSFPSAWSNRFVKPVREAQGNWTVTAGTYPVSKDLQGMRLESVELLAKVIRQYFAATWHYSDADDEEEEEEEEEEEVGLKREDVLFLLQAMDIVAVYQNNPLVGSGPGQHRRAWLMMREKLNALEQGFVAA